MEFRYHSHGKGKLSTLTCMADERGQQVASVIIMGEKECVLIDAQWTLANALRVTAEILESGRDLITIYTTHAHPDHYFGMGHIAEYFPNARLYAMPEVAKLINHQFFDKMDYWLPYIGKNNVCTKTVQLEPLEDNCIMLEGERIEIIPHIMGDVRWNSVVWIPSIKTLIGSDVLFNQFHCCTCETSDEERVQWAKDIDRLSQLGAEVIIPGHARHGTPFDDSCFTFTKEYLEVTAQALAETDTPEAFFYRLARRYPLAAYQDSNEMNAEVLKGNRVWDWHEDD